MLGVCLLGGGREAQTGLDSPRGTFSPGMFSPAGPRLHHILIVC